MMAASCWNSKHASIITLLAFLAPMACHGGSLITFTLLCSGGWDRPILSVSFPPLLTITIGCPDGSIPSPVPPPPSGEPAPPSGEGLYLDYYNSIYSNYSCPNAEAIVRDIVEKEIASQPQPQSRGVGAGLIRLHFHDCFVQGCDASVLLNTTASGNNNTELEGRPNKNSLRGFEVIDKIKAALEQECPSTVSCADILAFAARDAARSLSGNKIDYKVPGGRWDGRESFANQTGTLPGPFSDLNTLVGKFADQGLNRKDLVLLSGAHSIGLGRCQFRSNQSLDTQCGSNTPSLKVNLDFKTPFALDSQYYQNVVDNIVIFDSDLALINATDTKALVEAYRTNSMYQWEKDFGEAMVKMGKISTKTKPGQGVEIRKQCWTYNAPAPAPPPPAPSPSY